MVTTVTVPRPPNSQVTGANTTPGRAMPLFHIRLMPVGAFNLSLNSGNRPSSSACGVQSSSQENKIMSGPLTPVTRIPTVSTTTT